MGQCWPAYSRPFLDEIGDLSPHMQVKLLRVLQEKEFERVGSQTSIRCDVRIVTATSRNLEEMIEREKLRADLYYRPNVLLNQANNCQPPPTNTNPCQHFLVPVADVTHSVTSPSRTPEKSRKRSSLTLKRFFRVLLLEQVGRHSSTNLSTPQT